MILVHPGVLNQDDLARLDLPEKLSADHVQCAGFRGYDVSILTDLPNAEGPNPVRIAYADQLAVSHDGERIGSHQTAHCLGNRVFDLATVKTGKEFGNNFAVVRGCEGFTVGRQVLAQSLGIYQVAIVRDGNVFDNGSAAEGLGI